MENNNIEIFWELMVQLHPTSFIGLARYLGVKLSKIAPDTKKTEVRSAEDVAEECAEKFLHKNRGERRTIIKAMRQAVKQGGAKEDERDTTDGN